MKWVKLEDELKLLTLPTPEAKACFVLLDIPASVSPRIKPITSEDIKTALQEKGFRRWKSYRSKFGSETADDYKKLQERYEIFCGGWVQYFDLITRKGMDNNNHIIYFQWSDYIPQSKMNRARIYSVTIYIASPEKNTFKRRHGYLSAPFAQVVDPPPPPKPPPPL